MRLRSQIRAYHRIQAVCLRQPWSVREAWRVQILQNASAICITLHPGWFPREPQEVRDFRKWEVQAWFNV